MIPTLENTSYSSQKNNAITLPIQRIYCATPLVLLSPTTTAGSLLVPLHCYHYYSPTARLVPLHCYHYYSPTARLLGKKQRDSCFLLLEVQYR